MELVNKTPLEALEEGHIKWKEYELFGKITKKIKLDITNKDPVIVNKDKKIGLWYYGKTRTGKSTAASLLSDKPYRKMKNKWWDEYAGEDTVIIEDVSLKMKDWIGDMLKDWTDHTPFRCEIKGGSILVQPFKQLVVTSN